MNNTQLENYMKDLNDVYVRTHNKHMEVIKQYMDGTLPFEQYKVLDKELTVEVETIKNMINTFLKHKNSETA